MFYSKSQNKQSYSSWLMNMNTIRIAQHNEKIAHSNFENEFQWIIFNSYAVDESSILSKYICGIHTSELFWKTELWMIALKPPIKPFLVKIMKKANQLSSIGTFITHNKFLESLFWFFFNTNIYKPANDSSFPAIPIKYR